MLNSYLVYYDAGFKAGKAMRVQDHSCYQNWALWFSRAKSLETSVDKQEAKTAWDQGYHAGRNL